MKVLISALVLLAGSAYSAGTQSVYVTRMPATGTTPFTSEAAPVWIRPVSSATFAIDPSQITALKAGTTSVTVTTYLSSVTTSPTGLGAWINCANAKKVIFQFLLSADTDTATPTDTGTFYIDSDIRASTALPATQQPWNTTIGGVQYQTANGYQYTVPDPPTSLRWRMSGALRYTGSVYYTIVY